MSASLRDRLGGKEGVSSEGVPQEGEDRPSFSNRRRDEHDHRYSRQEWNERAFARRHYMDNFEDQPKEQEAEVSSQSALDQSQAFRAENGSIAVLLSTVRGQCLKFNKIYQLSPFAFYSHTLTPS